MAGRLGVRLLLTALVLAGALAAPALAQEEAAPATIDDVFRRLVELQDANLGIARQMAETEQQAARELQAELDRGTLRDPVHEEIARTFIANALTLASVILSPIQTRDAASGNSMILLIQHNMAMLQQVAPVVARDGGLASAIGRYTVLQMQTEDLASALQNGWNRYGRIVAEAQTAGLISEQAFDAGRQTWSLAEPVTDPAAVAALARPAPRPDVPAMSLAAGAEPAATPTTTTTTTTADAAGIDAAKAAEAEPAEAAVPTTPGAEPSDDTASLAPQPATRVPVPALTGTPHPDAPVAVEAETPPSATTTTVAEPAVAPGAEPDNVAAAEDQARLPAGGPLDILPATQPAMSGPLLLGDWLFEIDASGHPAATTRNLNGQTADIIRELSIGCGADGAVTYSLNAAKQFTGFRVYADQLSYRAVSAHANAVLGADAEVMGETLARGYEWAQKVADAGRRLTLRADDAAGTLALFSAGGYAEALDRVKAACAGGTATAAAAAPEEPPAESAAGAETPVPEAAPQEPEQSAEAPAAPPRVAPVPAPRIQRPIDIMGGG